MASSINSPLTTRTGVRALNPRAMAGHVEAGQRQAQREH
jgi:hypothetical protein